MRESCRRQNNRNAAIKRALVVNCDDWSGEESLKTLKQFRLLASLR